MSNSDSLSDYAAGEIRATLARRRIAGKDLAQQLGVSRSWVSYRLTGTTEITLNDLERIARALDVPIADLIPVRQTGGGIKDRSEPTPGHATPDLAEPPQRRQLNSPLRDSQSRSRNRRPVRTSEPLADSGQ